MKVDVAVQSYKKPESLVYMLFTLHKHCRDRVDTVWINDDKSGGDVLRVYERLRDSNALAPWKIKVRENTKRMGWWVSFVRGRWPVYQTLLFRCKRMLWNYYKVGSIFVEEEDIRYQWAINHTDKQCLYVVHDDMEFRGDILGVYLKDYASAENTAIVGDLGQCWRCHHQFEACTPARIVEGYRPSAKWPNTADSSGGHAWACRINEWSALLDVGFAKKILARDAVYFGNFDADGDTAAYWFSRIVAHGGRFSDPLLTVSEREKFYRHWEGGLTGHSVWVDQGRGKSVYEPKKFKNRVAEEFGYEL